MADGADGRRGDANGSGTPHGGWNPSRGFWIGMGAIAFFAAAFAVAGVLGASGDSTSQHQAPIGPAPTVEISTAPRITTPPDDFTMSDASPSDTATAVASSPISTDAAAPAAVDPIADEVAVTPEAYVEPTPEPTASSWTQAPVPVPPTPGAEVRPSASALVAYAKEQFGIEIEASGQDWGTDESEQATNIGAVVSAWERLPASVASAVADHAHGSLVIVSNQQGRTVGGWQPYGDAAMSFYTNSDQGADGYGASHQIVLATGAGVTTVLHELLHAYEMRNGGADQYVAALLDDVMLSFMETAGWRLLVSEQELLANANEPWETVNSFFAYEGPDRAGRASNPLEDFASAGAIFYGGGDGPSLGQPDVSDWFSSNLG
ncbi:MAG: hypothetical protein ACE5FA_02555 [Dehalococcoidia bacterium]